MLQHTETTTTQSLERKYMILSILTPTIPGREKQLQALQQKIEGQIGGQPVEHLILSDNRKRSIGAKRQALVNIARGQYIAFVDDDDDIADSYVAELVTATAHYVFTRRNLQRPAKRGGLPTRARRSQLYAGRDYQPRCVARQRMEAQPRSALPVWRIELRRGSDMVSASPADGRDYCSHSKDPALLPPRRIDHRSAGADLTPRPIA